MIIKIRLWVALQLFRLAGVVAPNGDHSMKTMGGELKFSKGKT